MTAQHEVEIDIHSIFPPFTGSNRRIVRHDIQPPETPDKDNALGAISAAKAVRQVLPNGLLSALGSKPLAEIGEELDKALPQIGTKA